MRKDCEVLLVWQLGRSGWLVAEAPLLLQYADAVLGLVGLAEVPERLELSTAELVHEPVEWPGS